MKKINLLFSSGAFQSITKRLLEKKVVDALDELGLVVSPNDPDTDDAELSRYFHADIAEDANSEALVNRLLEIDGVESAYIQTDAAPPF